MNVRQKKIKTKKRARTPAAVRATRKVGGNSLAGTDERLMLCKKLAYEMRMDDYPLVEIAETIAKQLNLEKVPSVPTVSEWITTSYNLIVGEVKEMAKQQMMVNAENLKKIIKRYMPMAMGSLHVEREETIDGFTIKVIDEKAFAEQMKAADLVGKTVERLHKLISPEEKVKEPGETGGIRSFQMVVLQELHNHIHYPEKEAKVIEGDFLTLESGNPALDSLK